MTYPASPSPAAHGAWAETVERLRASATTEPGRLRIIGAALALLVVAFGAVTAWEVSDRFAAADDVVTRSQPLSADAANIYRSLADADTAAATGFLAGAQERPEDLARYQKDIETASRLLVKAAANTGGSGGGDAARQIATLNEALPRYTGLIERARANNRQGLPLGGAYLRYANQQMTSDLLAGRREAVRGGDGQARPGQQRRAGVAVRLPRAGRARLRRAVLGAAAQLPSYEPAG